MARGVGQYGLRATAVRTRGRGPKRRLRWMRSRVLAAIGRRAAIRTTRSSVMRGFASRWSITVGSASSRSFSSVDVFTPRARARRTPSGIWATSRESAAPASRISATAP